MRTGKRLLRLALVVLVAGSLSGCSDPHVYGSIGVSSGYGSYGGWGSGINTSISIGGRIR